MVWGERFGGLRMSGAERVRDGVCGRGGCFSFGGFCEGDSWRFVVEEMLFGGLGGRRISVGAFGRRWN